MIKDTITRLCKKHTHLTDAQIQKIIDVAHSNELFDLQEGRDLFIDVLSKLTNEAIVVYHQTHGIEPSLYQRSVVGETALRENEPGVLRTLETGVMSVGLVAKTQENQLVRQTVYPIHLDGKIIAVLIYEKDVSENINANFKVTKADSQYEDIASTVTAMIRFNESVINQLDDAILIFDKDGFLKLKNSKADRQYQNLGYLEDIQGLHYDNLSLDQTLFVEVMREYDETNLCQFQEDVHVAQYFLRVKRLLIDERDLRLVVILHDVTEIKDKEAEIISKSVAIREIHHRVKNNLQTVASLLRIQARQCESEEAKKCLNESVSRVLAIAATHELLSTQIEANVNLLEVIELIAANIQRCFVNCKNIDIQIEANQKICIDSNRTVAIALIINELLQNCYEHAFSDCEEGIVRVSLCVEGKYVTLEVVDNGKGFCVDECSQDSLGLSIVTSYVKDKLKGSMKIVSTEQGTSVTFTFKI